jgi:DNA segregation ATPase FtsK/SpoIIIE, S-DNA-T family
MQESALTLRIPPAFISYSRDDSEFVLRLAEDLKAAGASVWLDRMDIEPGHRWDKSIEIALEAADRILLILSPSSVNSDNVMDEVNFALEENKIITPVLYKDCKIPFRLRRIYHIDVRTDYGQGFDALLKHLGVASPGDGETTAGEITPDYKLPPSSLFYRGEEPAKVSEEELRDKAQTLVQKCAEFGVEGKVTQINPGPMVTTFEFKPDSTVMHSRVPGLVDDLCLAMAVESILLERMADKSTFGIQVPNHKHETVRLCDVVECESFARSKSKLTIALGKDINGRIVTADLASMPHLLIAGANGSGKFAAIKAMILSVLFKSTPVEVRMILLSSKRAELGIYEGVPHLLAPIVTEPRLAANALRNVVREMERRLKLLAANHIRNIAQFNKLFEESSDYLFEDPKQKPLPYIMVVIDDVSDVMMFDRVSVEDSITRLSQMARTVGIHLILATERPSIDATTWLMNANIPARMSFRLATKMESRDIINSPDAASLLGSGDMLFLPSGESRLHRVHAPFVTDREILVVTEFWKTQSHAKYEQDFLEAPREDELFDEAVRLVFEFGKASTSLLQRRLRVGYGRAFHLLDMMEREGLVGPADGSKPREILKPPS